MDQRSIETAERLANRAGCTFAPRKGGEADKYTPDMWKRALAGVASIIPASKAKRDAFMIGFNGGPRHSVHYTARGAWERGRHTAVLLGYIEEQSDG